MIAIEKPRIECADSLEDGSYGKFVVEPLERGQLAPPYIALLAARHSRDHHQDRWGAA